MKKKDNGQIEPIISIITPYYKAKEYIDETAKSVLGQTFPLFEWIIVDDEGSNESIKKLKEIKITDRRIRIISGEEKGQGPAVARDIGIINSAISSKYIVFLDADDLYDKTFLECCYWTLETHPGASWAYTDSINFGEKNFLWRKWFDSDWEKEENILIVSSCIRKEDLLEVGGFGLREKKVYEDWYLWLKLLKAGKYPVRMNSLLTYYRQKENGSELKNTNLGNKRNAMKIISNIKKDIYGEVKAIQYPKYDYNWDEIREENEKIIKLKRKKDNRIHILMIIPWMVTGGADKFNLDLITKIDKSKFEITIITTLPSRNEWRKHFEKNATIYDLTTFLDMKDWVSFINYIIIKNNINLIFNTNSQYGYNLLPYLKGKYPEIPIIDYVHMEEWYWRNGGYSRDSGVNSNVIDKTFTCNDNSRKIMIKAFKRKNKEVKTIYVGVDEKKFCILPSNESREVTKSKYNIGYICRIVEQKRPYLFVEVCKKLRQERKDFNVIVAGDGALVENMKERVKRYKMESIFKFLGNVTNTKEIYDISDITVNTSIKEGIALTSYESLAMGVPVVSSDVGGQKELISEDVGVIVPCLQNEKDVKNYNYSDEEVKYYVDAINKVLNNLQFYKSNCRERILKKFTEDKMVKKMEKEFEKTANEPNKEKIENGKMLSKNLDILKELITTYLELSKDEYIWLVNEFNKNNVHQNYQLKNNKKRKLQYEQTLEYKIKHPIVVLLRRMRIYNKLKQLLRYGVEKV